MTTTPKTIECENPALNIKIGESTISVPDPVMFIAESNRLDEETADEDGKMPIEKAVANAKRALEASGADAATIASLTYAETMAIRKALHRHQDELGKD